MNRRVLLIGLAAASLLAATGGGAFTSMSAERGVNVAVASDESAFLAFPADGNKQLQCGVGQGQGMNPYVVTNQFGTTLDRVTLEVTVPGDADGKLRVGDSPGNSGNGVSGNTGQPFETLAPGESTKFTYRLSAGESATLQVQPVNGTGGSADSLHVAIAEAEGTGILVSTDERTFHVNCPPGDGTTTTTSGGSKE